MAFERLPFRPVQPQGKIECSFGSREPIAIFAASWWVMLDPKIQRTVGVALDRVAVTDRIAIERIRGEITGRVVKSQRPERSDWREIARREMNLILAGAT